MIENYTITNFIMSRKYGPEFYEMMVAESEKLSANPFRRFINLIRSKIFRKYAAVGKKIIKIQIFSYIPP